MSVSKLLAVGLGLSLASLGALASSSPAYVVTPLPTLPGAATSSYVTGLNGQGQAVGWASTGGKVVGFLAQGAQVQALGDLGGGWVQSVALNSVGTVVGAALNARQDLHAFGFAGGVLTDLNGNRPFERSGALAVNDAGLAVGWATYLGVTNMRATVFSAAGPVSLGSLDDNPLSASWSLASDINNAGQIVGRSLVDGNSSLTRAFLVENGQMRNIGNAPGSVASWATAINEQGWVTGTLDMGGAGLHAFVYDGSQLTDLGTLSGALGTAEATDINNRGEIVGSAYLNGRGTAFLYRAGQMLDINSLVGPLDDAYIANAQAISNDGVIAAQVCGATFSICRPVLLTPTSPVPEPASAALLAAGMAALALLRRRRA